MKYILLVGFCLIAATACKTTKQDTKSDIYKVSEYEKMSTKFESLYYSLIDSLQNRPAPKERSETKGLQRSELETSFARSIAFIDSLGLLNHLLENKDSVPQKERTIIDRREIHDTLYVNKVDTVYIHKTEYVTEELSFWDRIKLLAQGIAIAIVILPVIIIIIKKV